MSLFEPIFIALNQVKIRYVVVGGLATVLHGYARLTADIDIIVDLNSNNISLMLEQLAKLNLQPRLPVDIKLFADRHIREQWVNERNMQVFTLWDINNPMRVVDIFAQYPIDFSQLWENSEALIIGNTPIQIASIDDLIYMKQLAGRAKDLIDIERLQEIKKLKAD